MGYRTALALSAGSCLSFHALQGKRSTVQIQYSLLRSTCSADDGVSLAIRTPYLRGCFCSGSRWSYFDFMPRLAVQWPRRMASKNRQIRKFMKRIFLCLCSMLIFVGCCPCRKILVVEVHLTPVSSYELAPSYHQQWMPKTHRDSLLWKASRDAIRSANESTKHLNPLYR